MRRTDGSFLDSGRGLGERVTECQLECDRDGEPEPESECDGVQPYAVGECEQSAPPDAFEPEIQWEWWGPGARK